MPSLFLKFLVVFTWTVCHAAWGSHHSKKGIVTPGKAASVLVDAKQLGFRPEMRRALEGGSGSDEAGSGSGEDGSGSGEDGSGSGDEGELELPECASSCTVEDDPSTCAELEALQADGGCMETCTAEDLASITDLPDCDDDNTANDDNDGGDAAYYVTTSFTAAGAVDDYSEADKQAIGQVFADEAGVDSSDVTVTIEPASVIVTVTIEVPEADADALVSTLNNGILADIDSLKTALSTGGVSVQVESITPAQATPADPNASSSTSGLGAGALVGIIVGSLVGVGGIGFAAVKIKAKADAKKVAPA